MIWLLFLLAGVFLFVVFRVRKNRMNPSGVCVFVSGCDTGIGHEVALDLDSIGCTVFAGCLQPDSSRLSLPASVHVVPLDITDERSVSQAIEDVQRHLQEKGKELWALINNAGVCVYGEFEWQTWNQCQKQVEVNFLGTMRLTKAFLPLLRKSKGRVITITSINGSIAYPGLSVYSATKFALEGLNNALRLELRRHHGIRVIVVQPGDLARLTSIMSRHRANAQEMWDAMSEEDRQRYGSFFHKYHNITLKNYGLTSPDSFEHSPLLGDLRDAVLNESPANRYISATFLHRVCYFLLGSMPAKFRDAILDKVTDMLFSTDINKGDECKST
ncbi:D-beta-hydroxybutyrate dehydrogenase, mitochondrial, partial [Stegodyphus mimosarum]